MVDDSTMDEILLSVCLSLAPETKRFFFLSLENKNGIEENE